MIITAYEPDLPNGSPTGGRAGGEFVMVEACYFCRGTIEQRNIDVDFRWGKKLKMIRSVPAGTCRQCGERYFDAGVYKAMEKLARSRRKPATQVAVDVFEFRAAADAR